jgi:hypothetical protein
MIYLGKVIDIDDPEHRGRIRAYIYDLAMETGWCEPVVPYKWLWFLPDLDDEVYVTFEGNNPARPLWVGYRGKSERKEDENGKISEISDLSKVPEYKVQATHEWKVVFDDKNQELHIFDKDKNFEMIVSKGAIEVRNKETTLVASEKDITITSNNNINLHKDATDWAVACLKLIGKMNELITMLNSNLTAILTFGISHTHISSVVGTPTSTPVPPLSLPNPLLSSWVADMIKASRIRLNPN